jgi:glucans biosynthesis protein
MHNKTANEPHAKRRGLLKNGNPPGDPASAPRCGARTRKGAPCASPAVRGKKRCRMHGGLSTGPQTTTGLTRSKQARWKHGRFSAEAMREAAHFRELLRECNELEELMGSFIQDRKSIAETRTEI